MIRFLDRKIVRRVTGQSVLLVGISIVAGLLTLDRARIPADLAQSSATSQKQVTTVSLEQVRDGIAAGSILCIDARSTSEFEKGHIRGAISMPLSDLDQALSKNLGLFLQTGPVIIYCGGEGCDLSHLLARKLDVLGINVSIFPAGWAAWKAYGLPIEP